MPAKAGEGNDLKTVTIGRTGAAWRSVGVLPLGASSNRHITVWTLARAGSRLDVIGRRAIRAGRRAIRAGRSRLHIGVGAVVVVKPCRHAERSTACRVLVVGVAVNYNTTKGLPTVGNRISCVVLLAAQTGRSVCIGMNDGELKAWRVNSRLAVTGDIAWHVRAVAAARAKS